MGHGVEQVATFVLGVAVQWLKQLSDGFSNLWTGNFLKQGQIGIFGVHRVVIQLMFAQPT